VCTLAIAWRAFRDAPVVVAANRDERLDRPSDPPTRTESNPSVVAPRDADAGGTWIGYNDAGLFVGITNRPASGLAAERSRGLLVADALRESDAEAARRRVERAVAADEYDGFNLVVADATAAYLLSWDGNLRATRLGPGVHVVVNAGAALGGGGATADAFLPPEATPHPDRAARQADAARAVRGALTPEPGEASDAWLDRAASVLSDHEYGVCVHEDGFGTRSSSLVSLGDDDATYRFADGPPCETAYRTVATEGQI
jgi:hypothetical protein